MSNQNEYIQKAHEILAWLSQNSLTEAEKNVLANKNQEWLLLYSSIRNDFYKSIGLLIGNVCSDVLVHQKDVDCIFEAFERFKNCMRYTRNFLEKHQEEIDREDKSLQMNRFYELADGGR